jgi:hypothetical protein
MSERKNVHVDLVHIEHKSDFGRFTLKLYDAHKEGRKQQPLYIIDLPLWWAPYLVEKIVAAVEDSQAMAARVRREMAEALEASDE